jgi:putative ABC transport system permease protein
MARGALFRQKGKMLMAAFTVALGASLAAALLNVMLDVGDKVNQELKTYGANINVLPRGASLLDDLYGLDESGGVSEKYLKEAEIGNIKTIFWAFNIVDFTPYLNARARLVSGAGGRTGEDVRLTGTWFNRRLDLPTGESVETGMRNLKSWWDVQGEWPKTGDESSCLAGEEAAKKHGLKPGDSVVFLCDGITREFTVSGVFSSGGGEDGVFYLPLSALQEMTGKTGLAHRVEVSALTTPDNELSRRAAQDPKNLSIKEWETWYCTAYVSAICYQIDEVMTDAVSKPIRQVAESEGAVLEKTRLLMLLITILSLAGSALGVSNLVTAGVMERAAEIGLLKAIGAFDSQISALILAEIAIMGAAGGTAGYFAGLGFAQIIGKSVFGSAVEIKLMVIPLVAALVLLVLLAGSIPSIRFLLSLRPAEVLHGR